MSAAGRSAVTPLHDRMYRSGSNEPPCFQMAGCGMPVETDCVKLLAYVPSLPKRYLGIVYINIKQEETRSVKKHKNAIQTM